MSRRWLAVAVALGACSPAEPGAGSLDELASSLVAALVARDGSAFTRLVMTADELLEKCPSVFSGPGDRQRLESERSAFAGDAQARFESCARFDWQRAVEVEGERRVPKLGERAPGCTGEVVRVGTFESRFRIGDIEVFVSYTPTKLDGRFLISGDFMCVQD